MQIRPQFFLVIVVTDRHTQTNAGENIFPRFRGDKYYFVNTVNGEAVDWHN